LFGRIAVSVHNTLNRVIATGRNSAVTPPEFGDGDIVCQHACKLGCEGMVSKQLGSSYRSGRADCWVKVKNPNAPAVTREAEEDWGH
jgi:ATP-dependent DNA ligase